MSTYDIVIVGAGTAGMMCAIFAAKRGLQIAVVEKDNQIGGSMHWSGGHMSAGGTKRQKRLNIEDSPEAHYKDILRINENTGDLALIKKAVDLAPGIIDWLEDEGFGFAPECPRIIYGHVPYEVPRTHYGVDNAKSILKTILPHWEDGIKNDRIHLYLQHKAVKVCETNDRYDTVTCLSQHSYVDVKGHHILITTGGYGSNPEFFQKYHPAIPLVSTAYPSATADGFEMIFEEGGVMRMQDNHLSSLGGIELPPGSGKCDFYKGWASVLTSVYRQPRDIYVDQNGYRFMKEDEENADTRERTILAKDIWHFWIIFDETSLLEREEDGNENPIIINWNTEMIKEAAEKEEFLFSANTVSELAEKIKVPSMNLTHTIERFNQFVDDEEDKDYGRMYLKNKVMDAPFYGLKVHASVIATFGGVNVNEKLQVLNRENQVLEGLYAAGEILGLGATSGGAFCSGMAITPALSFGKWLGETLEKRP